LELLDAGGEWFYMEHPMRVSRTRVAARGGAASVASAPSHTSEIKRRATCALRAGEWELRAAHGALLLTLATDEGLRVWRVSAWDASGGRLCLEASRRAGGERARLEFTPRASASAERAELSAARLAACERLAALVCAHLPDARVEDVRVSRGARRGEPGRDARVLLGRVRVRVALTGPLVALAPQEADDLIASSLAWLARLADNTKDTRPLRLRLVVPPALTDATAERLALLRDSLRRSIDLDELDEARQTLAPVPLPELDELLSRPPRFRAPHDAPLSPSTEDIIALAPEAIDAVRSRRGETLRFRGLPFARVRTWLGREHVWFGVDVARTQRRPDESVTREAGRGQRPAPFGSPRRQLLDEHSREQFFKLLSELDEYRRADTPNTRHAFYRAAPEAWLESLLRRDITRLDPYLRLAPLHAQFRTSGAGRPVDLLALRRDGRLVVVELKTAPAAALPLQAADYWRRVEAQRLCGALRRARLFGDAEIQNEPPLVYLAAPLLSFHRHLAQLARALTPRLELYRFDLNEDWRSGVRVARRGDLTGSV
ncbi:MAG TPA: hypothetical protein VGV38_09085, partial [Pyrinomonadaceae bacterium]|nr:hypothetical protein [Pyrinomonadaceae bacterium]